VDQLSTITNQGRTGAKTPDSLHFTADSDSQTKQIKDEIANLDSEIENLQSSLKRALEG
jgi:hypothetical protein